MAFEKPREIVLQAGLYRGGAGLLRADMDDDRHGAGYWGLRSFLGHGAFLASENSGPG